MLYKEEQTAFYRLHFKHTTHVNIWRKTSDTIPQRNQKPHLSIVDTVEVYEQRTQIKTCCTGDNRTGVCVIFDKIRLLCIARGMCYGD